MFAQEENNHTTIKIIVYRKKINNKKCICQILKMEGENSRLSKIETNDHELICRKKSSPLPFSHKI